MNERVVRLNAAFCMALIVIFGLTQNVIPVVFLAIDFLLRSTALSGYSLIGITSKGIVKYFQIHGNSINAGPKIFAARLGLTMSSIIILAMAMGEHPLAYMLAAVLGLFSFLEAAFGICVACRIYPFVFRWLIK